MANNTDSKREQDEMDAEDRRRANDREVIEHDCDESCQCCGDCYRTTGREVCNRTCQHADSF
jgi:hypothetical protein